MTEFQYNVNFCTKVFYWKAIRWTVHQSKIDQMKVHITTHVFLTKLYFFFMQPISLIRINASILFNVMKKS